MAKSRYRSEHLESILWDGVLLDQLRFGLRWNQFRSWFCFALDDGLSVDRGNLIPFRCWVGFR